MNQIKELMCKIERLKTFLKYENIPSRQEIYLSFNTLFDKIQNQKKLNNNDRFILINFTLLLAPISLFDYFKKNKVYFDFNKINQNKSAIIINYEKYHDNEALIQPDDNILNIFKPILENGFTSDFSVFYNLIESKCIENNTDISNLLHLNFEEDIIHQSIYYGYECARYSNSNNHLYLNKDVLNEPEGYNKFKFLDIILKEYNHNIDEAELFNLKSSLSNYFDSINLRKYFNYDKPPYSDFKIEFINIEDLFLFLYDNNYI